MSLLSGLVLGVTKHREHIIKSDDTGMHIVNYRGGFATKEDIEYWVGKRKTFLPTDIVLDRSRQKEIDKLTPEEK